jgi:hypothetical protein
MSLDTPDDSVLVYGSVGTMMGAFLSGRIGNLEMIQLNPSQKPAIITPARDGTCFYTEPLPVGSSIRFFGFTIKQANTTTFYMRGVQGSGPTDVKLTKPGLYFMGSLVYCYKEYIEKMTKFGDRGWEDADLYPVGDRQEIDILKTIQPKFNGTDWEPVIAARIEELKK